MTPVELIDRLKEFTADLLWMSETDAPFEVCHWQLRPGQLTQERLLQLVGRDQNTPVKTVNPDQFFSGVTVEQDWFGEEERVTAQRYRELIALLKQQLTDLTVYRVGEVEVGIYIVGQTGDEVVGLATQALET